MAQKVKIILVDDLDGGSADETVRFGLDGVNYEIDLSSANAEQLRSGLERFVAAARKASGNKAPRGKAAAARNQDSAQIRQWAREHGYTVNSRGRIQAEIQEAYQKANS
ncbi:Lsr2 family protein [Pseudarthrobacter sp. J75]|uniref:histone-like nucleoid-structuring protein Lsr2 n=1 Tax=unclassified Pseudarthrobacter TaxID=2647000 RepID=UPI002E7FD05C|nr:MULTISPECIES: Lsr2 family protein [unclassified Pseudarthrobacter]MEE2521997.1 Lsr2 family protein [Pseudarthrobacter sp. J47]MEE2528922.1 Lsr2 family protein [Pseudarthrobacter sp. J75]MEE2570277.1 Lsr2 family protein [Pseudarthrobacter sp. J64]